MVIGRSGSRRPKAELAAMWIGGISGEMLTLQLSRTICQSRSVARSSAGHITALPEPVLWATQWQFSRCLFVALRCRRLWSQWQLCAESGRMRCVANDPQLTALVHGGRRGLQRADLSGTGPPHRIGALRPVARPSAVRQPASLQRHRHVLARRTTGDQRGRAGSVRGRPRATEAAGVTALPGHCARYSSA